MDNIYMYIFQPRPLRTRNAVKQVFASHGVFEGASACSTDWTSQMTDGWVMCSMHGPKTGLNLSDVGSDDNEKIFEDGEAL